MAWVYRSGENLLKHGLPGNFMCYPTDPGYCKPLTGKKVFLRRGLNRPMDAPPCYRLMRISPMLPRIAEHSQWGSLDLGWLLQGQFRVIKQTQDCGVEHIGKACKPPTVSGTGHNSDYIPCTTPAGVLHVYRSISYHDNF